MAQLVKLEPGDILVLSNLGPQSELYDGDPDPFAWLAKLRDELKLAKILVFEGDVDLSSLPADWTPGALEGT